MANPWEQKNRWGKGSAAWNRWMDPEAIRSPDTGSAESMFDDPAVGYFDENAMRFGISKSTPAVVRMISRAEHERLRTMQAEINVKHKLLVERSKAVTLPGVAEQTAFALDLLERSTARKIELVAYVGYDFAKGRISLAEERKSEGNTLISSYSYSDWRENIPLFYSTTGQKTKLHYVEGSNGTIQIIGIMHTHPSGGYSVFSDTDLLSANAFGGSIFAVQDGKVLFLDAGDFPTPKVHLMSNGHFDFIGHCLSAFSNGKQYRH